MYLYMYMYYTHTCYIHAAEQQQQQQQQQRQIRLAQCLRTPPVARRLRALLRTRLIRQTPLLPPLGGGGCHALKGASPRLKRALLWPRRQVYLIYYQCST